MPQSLHPDAMDLHLEDIEDYAIFRVDPEGKIASWNAGAERLKGYTVQEAVGQPFAMLFTPEDVQAGKPGHEMRVAAETGVYQGEGVRLRKGGVRFEAEVTLRALSSVDGKPRGFVKVTRDISQRKRIQEELRQRAEFEQQLIGIVSHDLRTPISAITLAAALLLRSKDLSTGHGASVSRILSSAERAHRMISSLLDFTQARLGGGLRLSYSAFELREVVEVALQELELAHPGGRFLFEPSGDVRGEWDSDRVIQLLTNLVNNALTHGQQGGPVTVRLVGEPDAVRLQVHNPGGPITPEMRPHLFEPMRRGEGTTARTRGSVGLGLFIVKQVALAHGGDVDVQSSAEEGTTFTVRLPRLPPARKEG
jgi:PAS domain S-box-containing protein